MSTSTSLTITNAGLLKVCRELLNYRTFKPSLISVEGTPVISSEGICTQLSDNDYCYKNNVSFTPSADPITVAFSGVFLTNETEQYAWALLNNSTALSLSFTNTQALIKMGSTTIATINVSVSNEDSISAQFKFTSTEYEFSVIHNNLTHTETGSIPTNLFTGITFNSILLGKKPGNTGTFWNGDINLPNFVVSNQEGILYSPSIGNDFHFTQVLIGDGTFPLSDTSVPVIDHVYEIEITGMYGSGNTLYITTKIDADAYLDIREIALYVKDNISGGNKIFCIARDVNVYKGSDLDYDLILTIDLSINVVNIVGFPGKGDIIVKNPEYAKYQDFQTVQRTLIYVDDLLEKIIRKNANLIGNDAVFPYYQDQRRIAASEDDYHAAREYQRLYNKVNTKRNRILDTSKIETHGTIDTPENGALRNFSTSNYITSTLGVSDSDTFIFKGLFSSNGSDGTFMCLSNNDELQPITVFTENGKCGVKIAQQEAITVEMLNNVSTYYRQPLDDIYVPVGSHTDYRHCCAWRSENSSDLYNMHLTNNGSITNSSILNVAPNLWAGPNSVDSGEQNFLDFDEDNWNANIYELTNSRIEDCSTWNWYITFPFTLYESGGTHFILGKTQTGCSIRLYVENNKLKTSIYEDGDFGSPIFEDSADDYTMLTNTSYVITIGYDGYQYFVKLYESSEGTVHDVSYPSFKRVSWVGGLAIGLDYNLGYDLDVLLNGYIDFGSFDWYSNGSLFWKGASRLDTFYTATNVPTVNTTVYDNSGMATPSSILSFTNGYIVDENDLFLMNPYESYFLKITCTKEESTYTYTILNSRDGIGYSKVLERTSPYRISTPVTAYFGVCPNYVYEGDNDLVINITNPLSGTVYALESEFVTETEEPWFVYKGTSKQETELLQYYHIPATSYATYSTADFVDFDRKLTFTGNVFEGNTDLIDFHTTDGLSLSVKVNLIGMDNKVILVKKNNAGDKYFTLELKDYKLIFTLYNSTSESNKVEYYIPTEEYKDFTGSPILITIMIKGNVIKIYRNNDIIIDYNNFNTATSLDLSEFFLSNSLYLAGNEVAEGERVTYGLDIEPDNTYVRDIVVTDGLYIPSGLYYVTNVLDTNF